MIKYTQLWDEIKYLIQTISGVETDEYEKDYMKINFNSDDKFPLNKILKLHNLTIVVRFVFQENGKYYPEVFLKNECLC